MEYYVAGTRLATRASLYEADLAANPGCEGATHFVHAYNLGAFALGSKQNLDTEVKGSAYGFGAEGATASNRAAEKKGGDLAVCKSDSATEVGGCKAPIRLSLREIRPGESPDAAAMKAPDTDASVTAAATVDAKLQMSDAAKQHLESAMLKHQSGDGKGCVDELDAYDSLNPTGASTEPKNRQPAILRGECLMMGGKCKAGKTALRKAWAVVAEKQYGAAHVDGIVKASVDKYCQGGNIDDADKLSRAVTQLRNAATIKPEKVAFCKEHAKTARKLHAKVGGTEDEKKKRYMALILGAPGCFAKAGDCKSAWSEFQVYGPVGQPTLYEGLSGDELKKRLRIGFEALNPTCKGK